jgi:mannosyltransferase OCH1-like enzyme
MIEKTIHYIWVGNKEIPEKHQAFMRNWQELHPDWEIIRWNEKNFDFEGNSWVKSAIEQENWSLAADVIRSHVLLNYGGVYLDTDIELFKSFNELVAENDFFIGYESDFFFFFFFLGVKKGHRLIQEVHERYLTPCENINASTNMSTVLNFSAAIKRLYNTKLDGKTKKIQDNVLLLSTEYFYPKNYITHRIKITENTMAIHHLYSNWHSSGKRIGRKIAKVIRLILGKYLFGGFERIARINMLWKLNREYKKKRRK